MNKFKLEKLLESGAETIFGKAGGIAEKTSVFLNSQEKFGQYGTNIALVMNKKIKKSPAEIFSLLSDKVFSKKIFKDSFSKIELAPNGFINFYLSNAVLFKTFALLVDSKNFPYVDVGKRKKAMVEYVSANPTGPLTLHNSRGAVLGDVISAVLDRSGFEVTKEFYVNDRGGQIRTLGLSVLAANGFIKSEEGFYKGGYLKNAKVSRKIIEKYGNNPEELGKIVAREILENLIKKSLEKFNTKFDVFYSEDSLYKKELDKKVLKLLSAKKLIYDKDGAVYLKTSKFGDDEDRVIIKSNKEATYFLSDIAYHFNKFKERNFDRVINILGADHQSHKTRLLAAVKALGIKESLEIIIMQLVHLKKGEELLRMSKRKGIYITLDDLMNEVGKDAIRFFFLMPNHNTHVDFDIELAKKNSQENPVYYIQYAYARIRSIFRKAGKNYKEADKQDPRNIFNHIFRLAGVSRLISRMHTYFDLMADVAVSLEVNKLASFTLEFTNDFHKFYENTRIISEDKKEVLLRLGFAAILENFLKEVFGVIGITAREKM